LPGANGVAVMTINALLLSRTQSSRIAATGPNLRPESTKCGCDKLPRIFETRYATFFLLQRLSRADDILFPPKPRAPIPGANVACRTRVNAQAPAAPKFACGADRTLTSGTDCFRFLPPELTLVQARDHGLVAQIRRYCFCQTALKIQLPLPRVTSAVALPFGATSPAALLARWSLIVSLPCGVT
jgi:hypothetical protein